MGIAVVTLDIISTILRYVVNVQVSNHLLYWAWIESNKDIW